VKKKGLIPGWGLFPYFAFLSGHAVNITLTQISKRLLFRYYPVWLLINVLMSYNLLRVLGWMPGVGLRQNIVGGQLVNILMYLFIITPLYILKPTGFLRRLMVMIGAMLGAVFSFHTLTVIAYANHPEVFGGLEVPPQLILFQTVIGFYTIWFVVLAERSLLAEEDLAKEETKRLAYEKQLLEDRLLLLQAQIEPMLLLRTMKKIEGLYDTDPKRATTLQMHFIQYVRTLLVKTRKSAATVSLEMKRQKRSGSTLIESPDDAD
jgi:sensor histidine kinase YesM